MSTKVKLMKAEPIDILLIEDSSADAELTLYALKKHGVINGVTHLKDGAQALDFLFGSGTYAVSDTRTLPTIILLDLNMPKVGGMEVLEKVRSTPLTRKIPVIILTSSDEDPNLEPARALGANSHITKPVDFMKLSKKVAELGFSWLAVKNKTA